MGLCPGQVGNCLRNANSGNTPLLYYSGPQNQYLRIMQRYKNYGLCNGTLNNSCPIIMDGDSISEKFLGYPYPLYFNYNCSNICGMLSLLIIFNWKILALILKLVHVHGLLSRPLHLQFFTLIHLLIQLQNLTLNTEHLGLFKDQPIVPLCSTWIMM